MGKVSEPFFCVTRRGPVAPLALEVIIKISLNSTIVLNYSHSVLIY